ncbi:MAG: FAD-dependent oxidoreductase [Deltaproteobacteria bacterium]|jgi:NADPH-dependent glutamate synthase beta subunit-like oxidoreductase|nr:FAD-dependent oxidoreductase [Deltaproteobacteria bacterium]MBW2384166.1 FAD-dependent oxidoreductase [Deltaproteobacteria bacterium]
MENETCSHCVAVIGGATAGAEVAHRLAERGILVAVFEQNPRPFGKIEDGLPRWHQGLRAKEYKNIREKLSHPLIHYVPNTKIGHDIEFKDLVDGWGFTCVVLANGAWRDRPLPVEDAEEYVGKGLVYQNPFVIAFNHREDPAYEDETFEIFDDSIVVGGGLASIDVAKIITLSTTRRKLAERGIDVSITELEVKGIPKTLAAHDLSWEDLDLAGCTIYYRRRVEDMPLITIPDDASEERIAKVQKARRSMLDKAGDKFKLRIEPLSAPDELIVEGGRAVGLRLRRTRVEDGRVSMTDDTYERRGPVVISSIGSIPEPIDGIDMKGELFDFVDWTYGRLAAYPTVFSAGNVVTGKGNIVASRKHARQVSKEAVEAYLGVGDAPHEGKHAQISALESAEAIASGVADEATVQPPMTQEQIDAVRVRIRARQSAVDYPGDFGTWMDHAAEPC